MLIGCVFFICASRLRGKWQPRMYRAVQVVVELLNLVYLPSAQLSLSSIACTDARDAPRMFLNQFPAQECDHAWATTILPGAVFGTVLFLFGFPLAFLWFSRNMPCHF